MTPIRRTYCSSSCRNAVREERGFAADAPRARQMSAAAVTGPAVGVPSVETLAGRARRLRHGRLARRMVMLVGAAVAIVIVSNVAVTSRQAPPLDRGEVVTGSLDPEQARQWAEQAQASLGVLDQQIRAASGVLDEWDRQPVALRADTPDEVRLLRVRRDVLAGQRVTLESEVSAYQALGAAIEAAGRTRRLLDDLNRHMAADSGASGGREAAERRRLVETRDRAARDYAAKRAELEVLEEGIRQAMRSAPGLSPQFVAESAALISAVRAYLADPARPRRHDQRPAIETMPPRPDATSPRRTPSGPRQDATHGAPPNPGQARPEHPTEQRPRPVRVVKVRPGDTLSRLAAVHLGDASRWPEIYELNRDRVRDADLIRPGWTLRLPERG